jgi:hypothetical protein
MKQLLMALTIIVSTSSFSQDGNIHTVFKSGVLRSGGYGAVTNKFTTIRGKFTNISGLYGGWFVNHRFMIGAGLEAATNNISVPQQFSVDPTRDMSYEYGQFGLVMEYVIGSDLPIHPVIHLFSGTGFTLQYQRYGWHSGYNYDDQAHDENWFFVAEPGIQLEINLLKWMRLSPGVSYRASFGSDGSGMKDKDVRNVSYSATLKFGRF